MTRTHSTATPNGAASASPRAWAARVVATTLRHWATVTTRPSDEHDTIESTTPAPITATATAKRSLLQQGAMIAAGSRLGRRFVLTRKRPDLEPEPAMARFDIGWHATDIGARRFAI